LTGEATEEEERGVLSAVPVDLVGGVGSASEQQTKRGEASASHATLAVGPAKESFICPEWASKRFGGTLIKQGGPIKKNTAGRSPVACRATDLMR